MEDIEKRKRALREIIRRMNGLIEDLKPYCEPHRPPEERWEAIKGIQKAIKVIQECVKELIKLEKQL